MYVLIVPVTPCVQSYTATTCLVEGSYVLPVEVVAMAPLLRYTSPT
jgi:hypothetical protein